MALTSLLLILVVILLIGWAVRLLLAAFDPGPQLSAVIWVVLVVVVVLYLLGQIEGGGGLVLRHGR
jgi:hypothetical protein